MFKWMNDNFIFGAKLPVALFLLVLLFAVGKANATYNPPPDPEPQPVTATADASSDATALAGAAAGAVAGSHANGGAGGASDSDASATGGQSASESGASSTNDGNSVQGGDYISNAKSTFFSFSRSMPAAGRCFATVDGGGGDGGGAGFLGFNYLNKNCWYAALAGEEQNVEVKALLKCGSKHFRNAIAYQHPRKERQQRCVQYMVQKYVDQLVFERAQLDEALAAQAILINDHTSKETVRATEKVTRVVEACGDCFGEK